MIDLWEGACRWPLWGAMAWQDIKLRYRGSALGPFWLSLSMAVTVLALSLVYGTLFNVALRDYMPYLAAGLMTWSFISMMLGDACTCFTQAENFIKKIRQPLSVYVYRTVCRNFIILAHNFVIYVGVALAFGLWPGWAGLWLLPALLLMIINSVWVCLLLGLICARFRDVTQIVSNLTQVVFFITPILWKPDALHRHGYVVDFNPFHHAVELVRAPLLGHVPSLVSWEIGLGIALAGSLVTFLFFRRFRSRLAYWV